MRMGSRIAVTAAGLVSLCGAALAQTAERPFLYDARLYGKVQIPIVESTGNASAYIATHKGAFEPVQELLTDDALRQLSRPIGRVDIVVQRENGEQVMGTCTGTLLAGDYVITNHHCLPQKGEAKVVKASIVMDYLTQGGEGSKRYDITVPPEEWNEANDYAVAKVEGNPTAAYGYARLSATQATPGEGMIVFHHPLGRPKMMTRFRCLAMRQQPDETILRHRCDTMPGSSGSLLINNRFETIGLHFAGGLNPNEETSFNSAMRLSFLVQQSALLKRIIAAQEPSSVRPPAAAASSNGQAGRDTATTGGGGAAGTGAASGTGASAEEMSRQLTK